MPSDIENSRPEEDLGVEPKILDESHSDDDAPKMPDFPEGGLTAWLVVVGCFCVMFLTFGYINAFGVYEAYYIQFLLSHKSASDIAWIGSLQVFFQFSAALISGPINDRYGPRIIIWVSSVLYILSIMLTSICKEYYQFILCQGILGGITNGLLYTPAISIIGHYFHARRPLAMAIASSGSSLGGVIFPVMLARLLFHTNLGFGWTVRIIGFLMLGMAIIGAITIVPRFPARKGTYLLPGAFKNPTYSFQVVGLFFVCMGLLVPFFYLPTYARGHGFSQDLSFYSIAILNAGSLFGRIISGHAAQSLGRFNILTFSSAACGILVLCWMKMSSTASIIVFAVLYGFFSGSVVALLPLTAAFTAPHPSFIGTYIGMAFAVCSISALVGAPITGAMISHYNSYNQAFGYSGALLIFGAGLVFWARCTVAKKGLWAV